MADVLGLLGAHRKLTLQTGKHFLLTDGSVGVGSASSSDTVIHSAVYPFSVRYNHTVKLPAMVFLQKGGLLLILFLLLGALVGILVWREVLRAVTPGRQLANAVNNGEIIPWYQPIICSRSGEVCGVEVLARWKQASGVSISPEIFIPLATTVMIIPSI